MSSLYSWPGSRRCVCRSTKAGKSQRPGPATRRGWGELTSAAPALRPTLVMTPRSTTTSITSSRRRAGSTARIRLKMTRSEAACIVWPRSSTTDRRFRGGIHPRPRRKSLQNGQKAAENPGSVENDDGVLVRMPGASRAAFDEQGQQFALVVGHPAPHGGIDEFTRFVERSGPGPDGLFAREVLRLQFCAPPVTDLASPLLE